MFVQKRYIILTLFMLISYWAYSQTLIPYRLGDKWGYTNEQGEIIIKPQYELAGEFREKVTWVKKNGKYGYINKNGKRITYFKFDEANYFGFGTARVRKGNSTYCINLKGKKSACRVGCGGAITIRHSFDTYKKDGKIGILKYSFGKNKLGNPVETRDSLPAIWDGFMENQTGLAAVKKDSLWGIINRNAVLIVDYQYEDIEVHPTAHRTNKFFKIKQKGKYGFLDETGKLIVKPIYHKVMFYTTSRIAKVWIDEYFWGYIDETGKEYFKSH